MKVGEVWKVIQNRIEMMAPWERWGTVIRITRLYRDDEEMQDYVEYEVLIDEDYEENGPTGGGMRREELLQYYTRIS